MLSADPKIGKTDQSVDHQADSGDELRENRSESSTLNSEGKCDYEQKVEDDV